MLLTEREDAKGHDDICTACEQGQRWEFMVVAQPVRLPGRTGSPFNPIAIL